MWLNFQSLLTSAILKGVIQYYSSVAITADFCLLDATEKQVLKIMQDIVSSKAVGVDKLSGRYLKDGADIYFIEKSVFALCNLSISREGNLIH